MDNDQNEISETDSTDEHPAITKQDILDAKAEKYFIELIKDTFIAVMFIAAFVLANRYIPAMQNSAVRYMGAVMVALSSTNAVGALINFILYKTLAVKNKRRK